MKIKAGFEQAKLIHAHQALIDVISAALGGKKQKKPVVPQNLEELKATMASMFGARSVG